MITHLTKRQLPAGTICHQSSQCQLRRFSKAADNYSYFFRNMPGFISLLVLPTLVTQLPRHAQCFSLLNWRVSCCISCCKVVSVSRVFVALIFSPVEGARMFAYRDHISLSGLCSLSCTSFLLRVALHPRPTLRLTFKCLHALTSPYLSALPSPYCPTLLSPYCPTRCLPCFYLFIILINMLLLF